MPHPNSIANLKPGFYPPPNNSGKKYETRKKLLRRYLDLPADDGQSANKLEAIIKRRIQAALGERTLMMDGQSVVVPIDEPGERLSAQYILDSLFGKVTENKNLNVRGSISHNFTQGVPVTQFSDPEQRAAIAEDVRAGRKRLDRVNGILCVFEVQEAEFTDENLTDSTDSETNNTTV